MNVAFAQCLGVPHKKNQAKISLHICDKKNEFQKWECKNATLAIQGEDLFLNAGKRKENIVLKTGSETMSKWKIYGTMDDLCSRGHEDLIDSKRSSLWIGLNSLNLNSGWQWSGGIPFRYLNWAPGSPEPESEKLCAVLNPRRDAKWENQPCELKLGYICKKGNSTIDPFILSSEPVKCPEGWLAYGGHCFVVHRASKEWREALISCNESNGNLASIHNPEEHGFILSQLGYRNNTDEFLFLEAVDELWIGLNDLKTQMYFEWSDKTPVTYTKWMPGEPTHEVNGQENCVIMAGKVNYKANNYFYDTAFEDCGAISEDPSWIMEHCEYSHNWICEIKKGLWNDVSCGFPNGYICERHRSFIHGTLPSEVPSPPGGCPADWLLFNNQCYKFFGSSYEYWINARRTCMNLGGDLASIHNEQVQAFLTYHLKDVSNDPWIGLNDLLSELNFVWADGSAVSYTNWAPGSPKLVEPYLFDTLRPEDGHNLLQFDCVSLKRGPVDEIGKWNSEECYNSRGYICQKNSDPELFQSSATVLEFASDHSGGISYSVTAFKMNWEEAHKTCNNNASELASILDPYSQALLFLLAQEYGEPLWIGLNSNMTNGKYQWIDRWRLVYSKWSSGEPKQTLACVYLDTDGTWKTASCKEKYFSVCKISDGADLVSVQDYTEANFLANTIKDSGYGQTNQQWFLSTGKWENLQTKGLKTVENYVHCLATGTPMYVLSKKDMSVKNQKVAQKVADASKPGSVQGPAGCGFEQPGL
ncbi:hypothetical protein WISP_120139 [Willisornis vidua]|uniref:C-type lectin domain-containing protein n=1 Tax=Willisornis vidua TaxID=1566151 RepID=A0ABQ9CSV4_9PASS|nr:hypothetical protein WISP_120139 [Willisornis vidua]